MERSGAGARRRSHVLSFVADGDAAARCDDAEEWRPGSVMKRAAIEWSIHFQCPCRISISPWLVTLCHSETVGADTPHLTRTSLINTRAMNTSTTAWAMALFNTVMDLALTQCARVMGRFMAPRAHNA